MYDKGYTDGYYETSDIYFDAWHKYDEKIETLETEIEDLKKEVYMIEEQELEWIWFHTHSDNFTILEKGFEKLKGEPFFILE